MSQCVGHSPAMEQLSQSLVRIAAVSSTVLLQGESGTGKELVARGLHALSARAGGPFVPVNCASMSPELIESELFGHAKGAFTGASKAREGLFYYAQGGTLAGYVEALDMNLVVDECLVLVGQLLGKTRIQVVKEYAATQRAGFNRQELQQVMLNLIINAIQLMPAGGGWSCAPATGCNRARPAAP